MQLNGKLRAEIHDAKTLNLIERTKYANTALNIEKTYKLRQSNMRVEW